MMKIELPQVISANPFTPIPPPPADARSGLSDALELPIAIKPVTPPEPETDKEPPQPIATTMSQLVEAMRASEQLFQQAFKLALTTRDREEELLQRAEEAERERRHHEREAEEWKTRFEALDKKVPWWARKLFRT